MTDPILEFRGPTRWLSNFEPCQVFYESLMYPSTEHAYQAAKFPMLERAQFQTGTPGLAKKLGRTATLTDNWDLRKYGIMYAVCLDKFCRNPYLATKLLATGDAQLVEGNTWNDQYWGVCNGQGHNYLGNILMQIRQHLVNVRAA